MLFCWVGVSTVRVARVWLALQNSRLEGELLRAPPIREGCDGLMGRVVVALMWRRGGQLGWRSVGLVGGRAAWLAVLLETLD